MRYRTEIALWGATAFLTVAAVIRWHAAAPTPAAGSTRVAVVSANATVPAALLEDAADSVVENNPFRLARQPSNVPFGTPPAEQMAAGASPTSPPKPALTLRGLVGGPPWRAVLGGVPGVETSVLVSTGDTLRGLRIRKVDREGAVVQGMDTTWRLAVRPAWR